MTYDLTNFEVLDDKSLKLLNCVWCSKLQRTMPTTVVVQARSCAAYLLSLHAILSKKYT